MHVIQYTIKSLWKIRTETKSTQTNTYPYLFEKM